MVISQQLVQEIQGLRADKVLVFTMDKAFPSLTGVSAEQKGVMRNEPRGKEAQTTAKRSKLKRVVLYHSATGETTKLTAETGNSSVAKKRNLGIDNFMKQFRLLHRTESFCTARRVKRLG